MVTLPNFEDRHRECREYTRREGGLIGRSHFWAQLAQKFETTFESDRFVPIGQLALSYGPRLGADPGVGTLPSLMGFAARAVRFLASRVEARVPARVRWERAFRGLWLDQGSASYNPFTHPILGAAKCELTSAIFRMHYFFARLYPFCRAMRHPRVHEIDGYFSLVQRAVEESGLFFCCNRLVNRPGLGDTEVRSFIKYPWRAQNEDLILEENPLIKRAGGHLHIDRLQRVRKQRSVTTKMSTGGGGWDP